VLGQPDGWVRLKDAAQSAAFVAALNGVELDGGTPKYTILEDGPEWVEYNQRYQMFWEMKNSQSDQKKSKGNAGKKHKQGNNKNKRRDYK
jgi:hypothetical protein